MSHYDGTTCLERQYVLWLKMKHYGKLVMFSLHLNLDALIIIKLNQINPKTTLNTKLKS